MCFGQCCPHKSLVGGVCHNETLSKLIESGNGFHSVNAYVVMEVRVSYILTQSPTPGRSHSCAVLARMPSTSDQLFFILTNTITVTYISHLFPDIMWHLAS